MNDKIAVIVITYNRLKFLKEIIESIRKQTRKADEIFVINNSSSDGTSEWLIGQNDLTIIKTIGFKFITQIKKI